MNLKNIWSVIKTGLHRTKWLFAGLTLILTGETFFSLLLPRILSVFIDRLHIGEKHWLVLCALAYCLSVLLKGIISTLKGYFGEKTGWALCDLLRVALFKHICSLSVQRHKTVKDGYFLERVEGDINLLVGFFSTMLINMAGSLLMVAGVLTVFFRHFHSLGFFLLALSAVILIMFIRSQYAIANLWSSVREAETNVLGEFSRDAAAYMDIRGSRKVQYVQERLEREFAVLKKVYEKASFWGNVPSTIFYSLLNIAEGVVLVSGVYFLQKGRITLGSIYLILSYVGLLNTPFASLKAEFAQMPKVMASLKRIAETYGEETETGAGGRKKKIEEGSIRLSHVSFGYDPKEPVLCDVSFGAGKGEHILLEGRTGSGKSTILQLISGFYRPVQGEILIGGISADSYTQEALRNSFYYILQVNPVFRDTVRNNVTRFNDRFTDEQVKNALKTVHMDEWLARQTEGIYSVLDPGSLSRDEAQLLAWAGAVLRKPGILLADEFDASICEDTVKIIDTAVLQILKDTTVVMVTHQKKSGMEIHRRLLLEEGRIVEIVGGRK